MPHVKTPKLLQNQKIPSQKINQTVKKLIVAGFCIFLFSIASAQNQTNGTGKISGKIIDSASGQPLDYATITVFAKDAKKPLTGTTSNNSGKFEVTGIPSGTFTVVAEFIGYLPLTADNIVIAQNQSLDLKSFLLVKKQTTLKAVVITSQGKLIENKIDKMVFNAERDITSQSGVATDILKKVPQVSVDVNGNVELSGSSSIRFLIDGKPSSAFGSNIADVLQSIPASQIKSIEVITNPGARYDAEGLGGIINIILKKNSAHGINGNLSLAGGTRMENGSFNFNARKGTFGFNAFVSGNERLAAKTLTNYNRTSTDTGLTSKVLLQQDGFNDFKRHGYQSGIGFDWTYKEKNSFSGSLSYNNFGNNGTGSLYQTLNAFDASGNILSATAITNNSKNAFQFHNLDANLSYKKTFKKEDQELEINLSTSLGNNFLTSGTSQLLRPKDSLFYGTNGKNNGKENESQIEINYTQPFKNDVSLGLGGKLSFADIISNSNVLMYQPFEQSFLYDPSLSNSLSYHQKVYAFYSELSFPFAKQLTAKIGGRYERTEINSFYSNAQQQANTPGYNTFVPSIFFLRKIGDDQTIKLSYSKRIERPDYGDLNPFINTSDPQNITAGNPYLLPELGNRYELAYSKDLGSVGSFMINLFYRANNHDIQPYIVYYSSLQVGDSVYNNVSVSTRENIGLEKNVGVNLFGDLHVNSKLNFRSNLFFFQRHTINALDHGYDSKSFNYRFNLNASYQFTKMLAAEFFGNFNSARHEVQGRYPSFTSYSMAIRQQFWKKKGSLALTATNPFSKYVTQPTEVFGPGFLVNSVRKIPFRSFGINFTWKFGKLEFKKNREENNNNLNPPTVE